MAQISLNALQNRNLFSTHYLESLIKNNPEWEEDVSDAFNRTRELYNKRRDWSRMDEAMLEEFLIRPILKNILGHHFVPQAKVEASSKRPDYAFFENEKDLNEALENKGTDDLYKKALAVGDAKSWKTSLDKKIRGAKGSFEFQNPSYQIDHYLHVTPVQWGILTNGRLWRIYHKETSYKLDSYYEVDLVTILENGNIEGFKYFFLFFRLSAFIKDASGSSFLDRVKDKSIAYATKLRENLQQNVYKAMKILSEGFFEWKDNALTKNEHDLKEVQENTLKLLYRLLFIFYAESLRLLDRDNPEYKKLSLESIKYDIANKTDKHELILPVTTDYWNKLNTLFALINEGSESERFHIPKDILYIPAYNGGLFDPKRNPFLHSKKVGDEYLARAIDLLAREEKEFIDYSTLGTRQLGSIYEGLLEYRLKVAVEDLVAIKEKGHERWVPKKDAAGKTFEEIKAGAIYLATDKGERKATGSYYTPDYIVKYIVRNTLGPILDEKRMAWKEKGLGEHPFLHDILSVRVLDPAMGSGHFLVEACEFLANRLVEAWGEARPEELESEEVAEHDVHWARREVVRHCIFGVDLNPMAVELAKLSLWLETVAANKPLTFLDHHLKVGNSLIGAKVSNLKTLPSKEKKEGAEKQLKAPTLWDFTVKKHFDELLVKYGEFAAHPDDDLRAVKQKEQEYDALQRSELNMRLHELANIWVATYFGAAPPPDEYAEIQNQMNPKDFPDWRAWREREWFRRAQELAGEKRFFHWELEFPEIFYEKGAPKENPGWDAVVGNPPYVRQEQLGEDKEYFRLNYEVYNFASDIFAYFYERGITLLQQNKLMGFISNTFSKTTASLELRRFLKNSVQFISYTDFSDLQIFEGATTYPIIPILKKGSIENNTFKYFRVKPENLRDLSAMGGFWVNQSKLNDENWTFESEEENNLKNKIRQYPKIENVFGRAFRGIITGLNEAFIISTNKKDAIISNNPNAKGFFKPFLEGKDIDKWIVTNAEKWLILFPKGWTKEILGANVTEEEGWNYIKQNYPKIAEHFEPYIEKAKARYDQGDFWWELRACDYYSHFEKGKLVWPNLQDSNKFSYDDEGFYINAPAVILPTDNKMLLCLLNSKLAWFFFKDICVIRSGGFIEMKPQYFEQFPVRISTFTTPPERHVTLVSEAKALYSEFLGAPDSRKLLNFVSAHLEAKPEESDVIHGLLAYLAEQMIETNNEKNTEVQGFLRWLERELEVEINQLINLVKLEAYYKLEFDELLEILKKNRKKIPVNLSKREFQTNVRDEFELSRSKIKPLMDRLKKTDPLIEQVVYRLYGLTEDEVKIIEDNVLGRVKNLKSG